MRLYASYSILCLSFYIYIFRIPYWTHRDGVREGKTYIYFTTILQCLIMFCHALYVMLLAFNVSTKRLGANRNKLNFGYALFQRHLYKVPIVVCKTKQRGENTTSHKTKRRMHCRTSNFMSKYTKLMCKKTKISIISHFMCISLCA